MPLHLGQAAHLSVYYLKSLFAKTPREQALISDPRDNVPPRPPTQARSLAMPNIGTVLAPGGRRSEGLACGLQALPYYNVVPNLLLMFVVTLTYAVIQPVIVLAVS